MFPCPGCIILVLAWKIPADKEKADKEEEEKEKRESLRLVVMTCKSSTTPCEQRHHISHGTTGYSDALQIKSSHSPSGKGGGGGMEGGGVRGGEQKVKKEKGERCFLMY